MKLLKKSEVDKAKALDRQREIVEGSKLAARVDTLREVAATEEASLEKFRRETIAQINKEIVSALTRRDALQDEVKLLENLKAKALVPVGEAWREVNKEEVRLLMDDRRRQFIEREIALQEREARMSHNEKIVAEREIQTTYSHEDAQERLVEAAELKYQALQAKDEAGKIILSARREATDILFAANMQKDLAYEQTRDIEKREEMLKSSQAKYEADLKRLVDREKTLERNLIRYGKRGQRSK